MDAMVNGVRYREPLKTTNWKEAKHREKEKLGLIAEGKAGAQGSAARQTFDAALDAYLDYRRLHSAGRTHKTDVEKSRPLLAFFGKGGKDVRIRRITADLIAEYQRQRSEKGVAGRTINMEVGLLRRILKRNKQWVRLAEHVEMLPQKSKEPRVLLPEEKARLLQTAALRPEWQVARCAATIALNTTMRGGEMKGLRWRDVDLFDRTVCVRRENTKTNAGARVLPLNREAILAFSELRDRAVKLEASDSEHFVFPSCEKGHFDSNKPMKSWRSAWRNLTRLADLTGLRFHDLRHQAITELAENGLGDQTIMSIAGHVSRQMLDHYSHIRLTAKRRALEALETHPAEVPPSVGDTPSVRPN